MRGPYEFREAVLSEELEAIERLLHATFVDEIGQDADGGRGRLVDKFHAKNHYLVALRDGQVCGVVALHDQPPFSFTSGLPDGDQYEHLCPRLLEARRLAVDPRHRLGWVFAGLLLAAFRHAQQGGYRYVAISGLRQRHDMYAKLGFRPVGPPVLKGTAWFVPMLLDLEHVPPRAARDRQHWLRRQGES